MADASNENAAKKPLDAILARIGRKFDASFEPLSVDGSDLQVLSINNMQAYLDALINSKAIKNPLKDLPLWAKIWPASFVLGRYLRKFGPEGKSLLEIGCGCGICGLVAAVHGFAKITMGDIVDDALDFARANILRNNLEEKAQARFLDVTGNDNIPPHDIIAASEILYLDELHRPLLKFIHRTLAPGGRAVFCTDLARAKPRFAKLAKEKFRVSENRIGVKAIDEEGKSRVRGYEILILERKTDTKM